MASGVYKVGAVAVNEIRESYNQTRAGEIDTPESAKITIPGSFPDVAIITKGNEQMVLFPSYAKRHVKGQPREFANPGGPPDVSSVGMNEQDYWRSEWARHEDEKAVVDVDVRGWIYNPHRGPMNRRNRVLVGLARQLSGIPVPKAQQAEAASNADPSFSSIHQQHEEERERLSIAREAKEIERRGQAEKEAAQKGGYSERPKDEDSEDDGDKRLHGFQDGTRTPPSAPPSPTLSARSTTMGSSGLSEAEVALANANLMARIGPFMTTPLVDLPITLFFFNDTQSQSRTVMTDDSGHFTTRAALDFVPTHVRVLANEDISYTEPVQVIEPKGVSLISDIDDTIKRSNIALGTKEIFRNTFVRDLGELTVDGVKRWYNSLHDMGVDIHYCSNSPWQLYPVLATYFKLAGLPPGSLHLKRYSGMLQGIFEPVAERKKGTLEKIMNDFPERKFLLVGDSGEADLEVYTELAVANPGRIVAIFIRDVTTPERAGYFDSGFDPGNSRRLRKVPSTQLEPRSRGSSRDDATGRPALPPRMATTPKPESPVMGDLIDFSDEPEPLRRVESEETSTQQLTNQDARDTGLPGRKPPPRPAKPTSLKSSPSVSILSSKDTGDKKPPPPPQPRKSAPSSGHSSRDSTPHPLAQTQNSSQQTLTQETTSSSASISSKTSAPPPPPPRRRGTTSTPRSMSPRRLTRRRAGDSDSDLEAPAGAMSAAASGRTTPSGNVSPTGGPVNKKLDLWRRRLQRAQDTLDRQGIPLYTWRRGDDVIAEALGIVKDNMRKMGVQQERRP
ncbi:Uu.00g078150.m01.CDS01 [Anthostomella pinea]|uniref:Uu.00g078150.m01.CDS01 n=1 Tax=Anthostomella pinea TaxID=933095 RepID=A0AAI8YGP8_9PEZI|nr:Uu.00g078150.m01.CDS01 [Anthostomella pinea]